MMDDLASINSSNKLGRVLLVGAGPGDPNLLTIGAMKAIQTADVIVYDNLVSAEIRELFPVSTQKKYVGKAKGQHSSTQEQINQILIDFANKGHTVCRVKGGDSFVFGRGGEEMLCLAQSGIKVEVIPGITAASGCTSYANIPLTHRGLAQGCTYITAHAEKDLDIQWQALAQLNQTLVIYMGLSKVALISNNLIDAGMSRDMPVALIEKGCCPEQRTFTGQLDQLVNLKETHQVSSPALIVIGKVVSVAEQMKWLEQVNHLGQLSEQEQEITRDNTLLSQTEQLKLTA